MSLFCGNLYIHTLEKLPQRLPNTKNVMYNTGYIFICEAMLTISSTQY